MFNKLREEIEKIHGGKADGKTVEDIAKKFNVSVETIEKQIEIGIPIEHEHVNDNARAREICMDHLMEFPDYYTRLVKMEKEGEAVLKEEFLLLTEAEKEIKTEVEKAKRFFGGEKVPGIDTNRFVRLWNSIRDNVKMDLRIFVKLLNPLNWPKAIFFNFYDIIKSLAIIGTEESDDARLEMHKLSVSIADGKYKSKSAKELITDINDIRKKYGFKPRTFLESVRADFNGVKNRDFDGNIIDEELEEELKDKA